MLLGPVSVQSFYTDELWYKSLKPLMEDARKIIGDQPTYLSFDIDSLDPGYAPGTGKYTIFIYLMYFGINL